MTQAPPNPSPAASGAQPAGPIPPSLHASAGSRLVSSIVGDLEAAGRRFAATAQQHGIDLTLLRGTIAPASPRVPARVRQCCLPVPGAGGTAMLFISTPGPPASCGPAAVQHAERITAIQTAFVTLANLPVPVTVAQSLPEPGETEAIAALEGAGLRRVGTLDYLTRPGPTRAELRPEPLPEGITLASASSLDDDALIELLDRTYVNTLDCPDLCGMRSTADVLDSHRATPHHNPDHWSVIRDGERPEGLVLFTHDPAQRSLELVYLGLAPGVRGRRLARPVMEHALARLSHLTVDEITCAVDQANAPAVRLYRGMGFNTAGTRHAYVAGID